MAVNERRKVRMTDAEVRVFLQGRHSLSMATVGADGAVHLVAMWYGFVGGLVGVETKSRSQKVQNLRRDPRITILVESGDTYETLRGVEIVGSAEIIDTPNDRMFELCSSVLSRYVSQYTADMRTAVERMMYNRVGIVVHPHRTVSWDHTKLNSSSDSARAQF
jgi:PPOX class probable F420-dependent enzyme